MLWKRGEGEREGGTEENKRGRKGRERFRSRLFRRCKDREKASKGGGRISPCLRGKKEIESEHGMSLNG